MPLNYYQLGITDSLQAERASTLYLVRLKSTFPQPESQLDSTYVFLIHMLDDMQPTVLIATCCRLWLCSTCCWSCSDVHTPRGHRTACEYRKQCRSSSKLQLIGLQRISVRILSRTWQCARGTCIPCSAQRRPAILK
jgi:hypothetical protein